MVLLDLFRDHDIGGLELMEIHSDMLKGVVKVLPKEMEDKTKPLIE